MTADPNTAEEYAAAGAAASQRLRHSLGDTAGRNARVVVYADDLRTVLDDYDTLAEAWEADQEERDLCGALFSHSLYGELRCGLAADHVKRLQGEHLVEVAGGWIKWMAKDVIKWMAKDVAAPLQPDPARYFEDGTCRICGVEFGGNHKFMCGNGMADDAQQAEVAGAVKRTPDEWCREYGIEVRDPDGWRRPDAPAWEDPITLPDFYKRASESSVRNLVAADWTRIARDARTGQR